MSMITNTLLNTFFPNERPGVQKDMRKRQHKCKHIWIGELFDGHDVSKCEVCGLILSVFSD
jgi:hypothetical protein